jgi:hypothetical protein
MRNSYFAASRATPPRSRHTGDGRGAAHANSSDVRRTVRHGVGKIAHEPRDRIDIAYVPFFEDRAANPVASRVDAIGHRFTL